MIQTNDKIYQIMYNYSCKNLAEFTGKSANCYDIFCDWETENWFLSNSSMFNSSSFFGFPNDFDKNVPFPPIQFLNKFQILFLNLQACNVFFLCIRLICFALLNPDDSGNNSSRHFAKVYEVGTLKEQTASIINILEINLCKHKKWYSILNLGVMISDMKLVFTHHLYFLICSCMHIHNMYRPG